MFKIIFFAGKRIIIINLISKLLMTIDGGLYNKKIHKFYPLQVICLYGRRCLFYRCCHVYSISLILTAGLKFLKYCYFLYA